jgi:hypothetical protein
VESPAPPTRARSTQLQKADRNASWRRYAFRALLRLLVLFLTFAICIPACESTPGTGSLVVGVTSDFRGGIDLDRLQVAMFVGNANVHAATVTVDERTFPLELEFLHVLPGDELTVQLVGHLGGAERVVRRLITPAGPSGERRVVRLHLEQACDQALGAPTCDEATTTCIKGSCQSAVVPAEAQQPYTPDWMKSGSDGCKPGGAPEVIVGKGQSDFFTAQDYEVAQIEAGPQGGHHIWISARVKNLGRSGSITEVGGEIPTLGLSITPLKVVFTLDTDEGGWCKIFGLRFQLDVDGHDIQTMLGEPIQVYVTILDAEGDSGSDSHWFTLSSGIQ